MTTSEIIPLPFVTDDGFGARARLGLVVLETDQTIEAEARMLDLAGVDFYHARIPMDDEVTPTSLTDMEERLPAAAALLPSEFGFDAIGYGCTSAATLIGADGITRGIQRAHPNVACTNPISAAVAAFAELGVDRIAVVTPYTADVTAPIVEHFTSAGISVTAVGSFLESSDMVVARISPASVAEAVRTVAHGSDCEAVFVSCTSLRLLADVETLEHDIGKPIVSSNIALFWHLLQLAHVSEPIGGYGALLGQAR